MSRTLNENCLPPPRNHPRTWCLRMPEHRVWSGGVEWRKNAGNSPSQRRRLGKNRASNSSSLVMDPRRTLCRARIFATDTTSGGRQPDHLTALWMPSPRAEGSSRKGTLPLTFPKEIISGVKRLASGSLGRDLPVCHLCDLLYMCCTCNFVSRNILTELN